MRPIDDETFYDTGIRADEVAEDGMVTAQVGGYTAVITRVAGQLVAFSHVCPHAAADLTQGRLARGHIKCSEHGYTFDLRTGRATWPAGEGCHLRRFKVVEEEGLVKVRLAPPQREC